MHTGRCLVLTGAFVLAAAAAPRNANASAEDPADLVLLNGRIVAMDDRLGEVQAIAARGGRIAHAGSAEGARALIGPDTRVIDLAGALAIPGFIEGHGHFVGLGQARMVLDLTTVRDFAQIVSMVAEAVRGAAPGDWIVGRGWHQEKWERRPSGHVRGFPTHEELSAVSPGNPVLLTHASGHACLANARAMELAGISGATADPPGGEILRDAGGQPTGIFSETAQSLMSAARGPARREEYAQVRRAIELASAECLSKGITSFQDAGSDFPTIDALAQMAGSGALGVRLWVMIRTENDLLRENVAEYRKLHRAGGAFLTVGGVKRTIDGALGSRGAWLLEPYSDDPGTSGLATATVEDVTETASIAMEHGLQLCVHAIGDRANREVLDLFERLFEAHPGRTGLRWRIEHAQHLHPLDVPRFAELGVIASMQGVHCTSDGPWVVARLGEERARSGAYVWRSLLGAGAIVTNGTDTPVEDVDPIASFHATVTRRMKDGQAFFPEQRMSRMEALRSYTIDCAYAAFEEDIKGSLTPGKLADIVVLSKDILSVPEAEIPSARVLYTIVGGKVAYERPAER